VVVNQTPTVSTSTSTNPTTCSGTNGTIVLNGLLANTTYTVNYLKNLVAQGPFSITTNASGVLTITGLSAGSYTNVTVTRLGCTSSPAGPFTLTDPSSPAAPTVGSNSPVCVGGTINLFVNTIAGATYSWTGPNGFTSSQQNPSISNADSSMAGVYEIVANISGCNSAVGSTTVTINPIPDAPVLSSNSPICEGDTLQLSAQSSLGGTYSWTGPNGYTSNVQNPVILNASVTLGGIYEATVTSGGYANTLFLRISIKI